MLLDIINIICEYIQKNEILKLAKTNKEYYRYIMNEKTIMKKYRFKITQEVKNLDFISKLSYKIFNIDLGYININDVDMKYLDEIDSINIENCKNITDKGLKYLKNVRVLNMKSCWQDNITDRGLNYLTRIEELNISNCSQKTLTKQAFINMKKIRKLDAVCCFNIKDDYIDHLTSLEVLNVNACRLTDNAFGKLINLRKLNISNTTLSDKCLINLKKLEILIMFKSRYITDAGFQYLKGIKKLDISHCNISANGLQYLYNIKHLSMQFCNIIDIGLISFPNALSVNLHALTFNTSKDVK